MLRIRGNDQFAYELPACLVFHRELQQLLGFAVRNAVAHVRAYIDMLLAAQDPRTVDIGLSMFAHLIDVQQHITSRVVAFVQAQQMDRQHAIRLLGYAPLRRFVRHMGDNQVLMLTPY